MGIFFMKTLQNEKKFTKDEIEAEMKNFRYKLTELIRYGKSGDSITSYRGSKDIADGLRFVFGRWLSIPGITITPYEYAQCLTDDIANGVLIEARKHGCLPKYSYIKATKAGIKPERTTYPL